MPSCQPIINCDKLNDTLEIVFSNFKISNFTLNVYDRWGGKVFATQNPKFKWDGKVDYKDATIGMYNYDISYVDNRNKNQKLRGAFTLIR
jgi:gliding motility-associated-like protein